jgi:CheY-like chemotaxis protein
LLVVDDDEEWSGLITRLFAGHVVDSAGTFEDASKRVQPGGTPYDLAIVDLNLLNDPADQVSGDMLGAEILLMLRQNYPSTLRIALTGSPPRGALRKGLVDKYQVYDFFMKGHMDLHDLRDLVMDSPAAKAAALEASPAVPEVEREKAAQLDRLRQWSQVRRAQLRQAIEDRQNELRFAGRTRPKERGAAAEEALRSALDRLGGQLEALVSECAGAEALLAGAQTMEDVARAAERIDRLMGEP